MGVLNNPSNKELLKWIRLNFKILGVVALPDFAFRKAGSGMKTVLLFLKKYLRPYEKISDIPNYKVFFAIAKHIGYDSTLRPDDNELPEILNYYKNNQENREKGIFWLDFHDLDYRLDPKYYYNRFLLKAWKKDLEDRGFTLVSLRSLLSRLEAGKSPEGGVTRSSGEIPSITITNITHDGTISFEDEINFVPVSFYEDFKNTKGQLRLFDILVAKDGATTGKTAIIDENFPFWLTDEKGKVIKDEIGNPIPKAIFSEHVFRLRIKRGVNALYIHAFLNSEIGQLQLEMITSGGAQGGITLEFADQIFVPLIKEQDSVAKKWHEGISEVASLRGLYNKKTKELKKEIVDMIEESTPLDESEIKKILEKEQK